MIKEPLMTLGFRPTACITPSNDIYRHYISRIHVLLNMCCFDFISTCVCVIIHHCGPVFMICTFIIKTI